MATEKNSVVEKKYSFDDHPEHKAQLDAWRDKWIQVALDCRPLTLEDKAAMEVALEGLYRAASLPPPLHIVYAPSPIVGAFAATFASVVWWCRDKPEEAAKFFGGIVPSEMQLKQAVQQACLVLSGKIPSPKIEYNEATDQATWQATAEATWQATDQATRQATVEATAEATWQATDQATDQATWQATRQATWQATDQATWQATEQATRQAAAEATEQATAEATDQAAAEATWQATDQATRQATEQATRQADPLVGFLLKCSSRFWSMRNGGNQWAAWCAYLSFFRNVAKLPLDYSKWEHYEQAALHSGVRYMHPKFVIVCDRPKVIKQDDQHRPHCSTGPWCEWPSGEKWYAIHGVLVPEQVVLAPETITTEQLASEANSEVLRVMAQRMGWHLFLERMGTVIIDSWVDPWTNLQYDLLDLKERKGERQPRWLRMRSPVLKDGTTPDYIERVDPALTSAQAARTWQFQKADGSWPSVADCNRKDELKFSMEA